MKKQTVPFVILAIIHFVLLGKTFNQKKQGTLILLFSSIGIAFVFEYFVLNVFRMYTYYPKVFKNKWIDSQFGALLSQAVFVPIKATVLISNGLGWKEKAGATITYALVERIFIYWGIYKNNTWKTIYTLALLPFYFLVVQRWWSALQNNVWKIKEVTLLFSYWVKYTNIYYLLVAVFKKFLFRSRVIRNKHWDHFIVSPVYMLFLSVISTANSIFMNKQWKLVGLLLLHITDQIMVKLRIIRVNKWSVYSFLPFHFLMLLIGEYSYSLIKKISEKKAIRDNS